MADACATHPDDATLARCVGCDRAMCAACWTVSLDDHPTCGSCADVLTRPVSTLVPAVAAVLGLLILARIAWLLPPTAWPAWAAYGFAVIVVIASAWRLTTTANQRRAGRVVAPRHGGLPARGGGHPYRGAVRRAARRLAPPVSGTMAAFVVGSALVVTTTAVPALLRLPLWLELELVLVGWWLVWTVALTVLLYRGWRVAREPG